MSNTSRDLRFSDEGQRLAHAASLDAYASSKAGKKATAELAQLIIQTRQENDPKARNKHGKSLAEFERAVAAFLFELLKAQSRKQSLGWFGVSLASGSGSGEHVGYRARKHVSDGLNALGLIELDRGSQHVSRIAPGKSKPYVRPGRTTRIKALPPLLEMLSSHGLTEGNFEHHFIEDLPKRVIYLKARKVKNGSRDQIGKPMSVKYTPHVRGLERDVRAINSFLSTFRLGVAKFRGYKRRFNEGNAEDFNWNKGGRLYAEFQQLPSDVRNSITIDGEPTAELDVSASYLTVLHGIHGVPFNLERDAYASEAYPRDVIKAFINQSLGSPTLVSRWAKPWNEKFFEKHGFELSGTYRPKDVRKEVLKLHPLLGRWEFLKTTWADLMFLESEAMMTCP